MMPFLEHAVGYQVRTLGHPHPDVLPGTIGRITEVKEDGYGVVITGSWMKAGSDRDERVFETRTVWFAAYNLEIHI